MKYYRIRKGLDLPFPYLGNLHSIYNHFPSIVSLAGYDYPFKPHLLVKEGDICKRGDILFSTKDNHKLGVVSPVSGRIVGIHRGDKRALLSLAIQVDSTDPIQSHPFPHSLDKKNLSHLRNYLAEKGAWVYLRTRPFFEVPELEEVPEAIFVNAMDTRPGSIGMIPLIKGREKYLAKGLEICTFLTEGRIYFSESSLEDWDSIFQSIGWDSKVENSMLDKFRLERVQFSGKHPSGLSSTHIHYLRPASLNKRVWTIPCHLLADLGELIMTGVLPNRIRVSLSGPYWKNPVMIETILGSRISTLVKDHLPDDYKILPNDSRYPESEGSYQGESNYRIVSGSILHGWEAKGAWDMVGRFHNQISLLRNDSKREFLDWLLPGFRKFSITRSTFGRYFPKFTIWNTSMNGSPRALVPIGNYERVMPMDILPTQLLRALITKDWEEAIELGALELEEEDLSLCSFVCPGKMDFGVMLKETLKIAKKEMV